MIIQPVGSVRKHYGIRTDRYKLIHWYGKGFGNDPDIDFWELYDLKNDPNEMNNVYLNPKYLKVRNELHEKLSKMRLEIGTTEG